MPSLAFWEPLPNVHPATVHFAIALVPVAVLFDLASLLLRHRVWLDRAAASLYLLGGTGALVAYLTGRRAAEGLLQVPQRALGTLASHEDFALWTLWVVGLVALARAATAVADRAAPVLGRLPLRAALAAGGIAGAGLLLATAHRGGELVFQHGLGVAAPAESAMDGAPGAPGAIDRAGPAQARLERREDGSLVWRPAAADAAALETVLAAAPGSDLAAVRWIAPDPGEQARPGLELEVSGRVVLFLPGEVADAQVDLEVDLAGFAGTLGPVLRGRDAETFLAFLTHTEGGGRLVRRQAGEEHRLAAGETEPLAGRKVLTVSASGRHFYGRLDGEVVAHGHHRSSSEGACGLYLEGEGAIRILAVAVQPL